VVEGKEHPRKFGNVLILQDV